MTLATFKARISAELNKGTAFDSLIPDKIKDAVTWFENNAEWQYLRRFYDFTLAEDSQSITFTALGYRLKEIHFLRIVNDDGSFTYITQDDPTEVSAVDTDIPTIFWISGDREIWFDNIADQDYDFELFASVLTDWSSVADGDTPTILEKYENVLLWKVLLDMVSTAMQGEMNQIWQDRFATALKTALDADERLKQGARSEGMIYG